MEEEEEEVETMVVEVELLGEYRGDGEGHGG